MRKAKILVIDDDSGVRQVVCKALSTVGYESVEAADGRDGFNAFARGGVDLVITDVIMPDQEGMETIEQIREVDPDVPIIAISGSCTEEFSPLHDARLMGASHTMGKPFQMEDLLSAVRHLLRR